MRTRASRRVSLPIQAESAPISRSNSEMSLHPPMRRRSLIQTPGVATRTRPSPSSAKSTKSSFRHSHPPTPSASRQPSFEMNDSRFLPLPPFSPQSNEMTPLYRVLTPKDTDYSTTGAFKLGTLRITNGSPELTPNVAAALEVVEEQGISDHNQGDYFSKVPPSEPNLSHLSSQIGECQNPSAVVAKREGAALESTLSNLSITIPNLDLESSRASELQLSPDGFSQKLSSSPILQTQSRQAAVDDHLFDEDDQPEISIVETLDVRIDSSAKSLPREASETAQFGSQGVQRTDSGFVSNSKSDSSQSHSSLAKADSGYSSNVSVRSLRSGRKPAASDGEPRSSTDSNGALQKAKDQLSSSTGEGLITETLEFEKAPTPPPKDKPVLTKPAPRSIAKDATDEISRKPVQRQPAKIDTAQSLEGDDKPAETTSPATTSRNCENSSSSLSIGNNSQKPRRLQRFLSLRSSTSSKQTLTVHVTHAVDKNRVPSIPKDVEEKLREHTGLFPMTTKRLALKNQMSKETLKTILSVGSLELSRDDEVLSVDPSSSEREELGIETSGVVDTKEGSLKNTLNSMQSNFRHAAISVISSRKSTSRRPGVSFEEPQQRVAELAGKDEMMHNMEAELTSYESINSTLGNNGYDVATRALQTPVQVQQNSLDHIQQSTGAASSENSSQQKHRSCPPVSMNTRGSFRPPPRASLNTQGPTVLRAKSRVAVSQHSSVSSEQWTAYQASEGLRRGRSASGFQYRATSCGPATRRNSVDTYRISPGSSRHNSITSSQSDPIRGPRGGYANVQNPTGVDSKHKTSMDRFSGTQPTVHLAQPAHRGPSASSEWNPQNSSHTISGQYRDQQGWLPPFVPRDPHPRNFSAGSRPFIQGAGQTPYRILHSYNSPAYRNAPIWG